jgi:hypothetical protein
VNQCSAPLSSSAFKLVGAFTEACLSSQLDGCNQQSQRKPALSAFDVVATACSSIGAIATMERVWRSLISQGNRLSRSAVSRYQPACIGDC